MAIMQVTDPLVAPSRAYDVEAVVGLEAAVHAVDDKDRVFAFALERACNEAGVDFFLAYSHCANETDLFRVEAWNKRLNPAGIGITGEPGKLGPTFPDARAAARFYVALLLLKIRRGNAIGAFEAERATAPEQFDGTRAHAQSLDFPVVDRLDDLCKRFGPRGADGRPRECVWMCDPSGPQAIVAKSRLLFPGGGQEPRTFRTAIPGLPGGPLVTDYPVVVDLIPVDGFHRPGRKAGVRRRSVQHGNGNPTSSARGERNFLHAGAPNDQGRPQQLSYHATADDTILYVLVPLDEVTYQAADGAGPGNEHGYSLEMVEDRALWNNVARRGRLIHICADFMARVGARLGPGAGPLKPERHWDFNWVACGFPAYTEDSCGARHHCPDLLMSSGLWSRAYEPEWWDAYNDERARMETPSPTTSTTTTAAPPTTSPPTTAPPATAFPRRRVRIAKAGPVGFRGVPDVVVAARPPAERRVWCVQGTTFRTYPNRGAPAGTPSPAHRGRRYTFDYVAEVKGETWYASKSGSWALARAFSPAKPGGATSPVNV